jgi:hypothetical protein
MSLSLKQRLAQVGVVSFILCLTAGAWGPFLGGFFLPAYFACMAWMPLLVIAALLPESERDSWGSIWPLSGYDNAIDAIYTRGPWRVRYDELADQETQRNVTDGLGNLFAQDSHN